MKRVIVIGGGPAGLMAAEAAAGAGAAVTVFDAMPTMGRKFLMAGKSGLNITHSEDMDRFVGRFGAAAPQLASALEQFDNRAVTDWCAGLGIETFTGSSGRVFPVAMKASPLLRNWLARLAETGVRFRPRHRWTGLEAGKLIFEGPDGAVRVPYDSVVLALGGASWPRLGSDAAWVELLRSWGVSVAPFRPANCGFEVRWSPIFAERFAGQPIKPVVATSAIGPLSGEFVVTGWGVEGSLIYHHAAALRDALERDGAAVLTLDLLPSRSRERIAGDLARQDRKVSFSNRLRKACGLDGARAGLVRELAPDAAAMSPEDLAAALKALPLPVVSARPIAEAISSAGGVAWSSLGAQFALTAHPDIFVAGEMLDWEAPTGGYLLTACLATGRTAGLAAARRAEHGEG
ncbi:MAG: TIGR03862 family flavoprotein [Devosia sp.]|uniref:TIGR03862 family flavoprotein n=1 Tax=Devosia sp. TaxID=1871048 RepID=UPI0024C8ADF8|nr:TIGR03862 family flavoprotein [Devosia sp.]UYN98166.1 MAG: TIGR03862 family flavoprotein [Devosia sp.]